MDEKTKFGFLAYLLDRLGEKRYYGLIVAQKIVYFLQEAFKVDLPYEFYFYHFGPYSDALDWDLRMMKSFGLISIGSDPKETGYSIEVKKEVAEEWIQVAQDFVNHNSRQIEEVLGLFGNYEPNQLELASTIHFVHKNNRRNETGTQLKRTVVEKVGKLKPKFAPEEIGEQYDYLKEKSIIE